MLQQLPFLIPFYGDHQYLPISPQIKGELYLPQQPGLTSNCHFSLLRRSSEIVWWPVEDAFMKSFAPAVMIIVDPRWREVDPIYWGRLLVIC
jgi:hypothetical protein